MQKVIFLLATFLASFTSYSQSYEDYIGAGHNEGTIITSSSNYQRPGWTKTASAVKTFSGDGLEGKLTEASRFLSMASIGASEEEIHEVAELGIDNWIDNQMAIPPLSMLESTMETYNTEYLYYIENGGDPEDWNYRPDWSHLNYAWWQQNMTRDDLLRQRIALALSEIVIVSEDSDLASFGDGLASFYDIYLNNAFGNYKDILLQTTLHPTMGFYLSHLNNPRSIPSENIHPDENYAREIMQLFSIGLYELNDDGTRKTDGNGNFIPTYDNNDIKEFAKVFTGLGIGDVIENEWIDEPEFFVGIWVANMTIPMIMYEEWHEPGEKHLLNGFTIPSGQSGLEDIEMAVDHLFNHPNVGPFIGRRLIQRLVKSNPTPEYIGRITAVFNDNGEGVRGDLGAVVKAILTDEEAITCDWINDPVNGRLREPILRYTHFAKGIGLSSPSGLYWNVGYGFNMDCGQHPMASPSVFNFFLPDFQPNGPIANAGLVGPEFQIHNSRTSVGYINQVNQWAVWGYVLYSWGEADIEVHPNFIPWVEFAQDPEVLINKLDLIFTHGQLSDRTRNIIKEAIAPYDNGLEGIQDRLSLASYLIMISPDYAVFK